ncbi:HIRA-interacting protein 5 [Xylariomycetidae sp. FL2044]|nr:HIRA-interacting protein 5 [Xylariomycetidae sp. FL2044]
MPSKQLLRPATTLLCNPARRIPCNQIYRQTVAASARRQAHTSRTTTIAGNSPHRPSSSILATRPTTATTTFAAPRGARSIFIQTETTPNADALKFLPNHRVLPPEVNTTFVEYLTPRSTIAPPYPSPLASQLMGVEGVTSVFYGPDFITVTKASEDQWAHIRPEIFSLITEAITSGQPLVTAVSKEEAGGEGGADKAEGDEGGDSLSYNENDSEVVGMIKELLETRVRPAIQEDGGDIEFRGFEDGMVMLKLRGACRTCDSSTVTLKNGIEGMLMHYIEEVKGVHQVMDQEEEIAMKEFAKFEEKLRAQKGPDAAPTSPGKGSIDSVPG